MGPSWPFMVQPFVTWHRICTSEEDYLDSLLRLLPRVSTWAGIRRTL